MAEVTAQAVGHLATKADLAARGVATTADLAALKARIVTKLEILKGDMRVRPGSMMVVAVGVSLAGFKLIH